MAATTSAVKKAKRPAKAETFSADEKAAMREHAAEVKRAKAKMTKEDGTREVLDKIASMPEEDRHLAQRIHEIVTATAPDLVPRTWYGMPAYARDGNVVCFFQDAGKFKSRYATLGFSDKAKLDDGNMWPSSFAVKDLGKADEERIAALVKKAVS